MIGTAVVGTNQGAIVTSRDGYLSGISCHRSSRRCANQTRQTNRVAELFGSQAFREERPGERQAFLIRATDRSLLLLLRRLGRRLIALILLGGGAGNVRCRGLGGIIGTRLRSGLRIGHEQLLLKILENIFSGTSHT
jgi:hypothetical protein